MLGFDRLFWMVFVLFVVVCCVCRAEAKRKKDGLPLVEESGRKKLRRQSHCNFGNTTYELEERWRPDLGPPFGVLYCVRCECVAIQKKKRIVARVKCENIKNDCPKPTCDSPVLLPERCCKTCPGEDSASLEEDLAERKFELDDDDRDSKEFSALLTGRTQPAKVPTLGAARGYLTYLKRDLHFGIQYTKIEEVTFVRFTDDDSNILEEHEIEKFQGHANRSMVCGVWNRVPKVYRRLLLKERLHIVLVTENSPEGEVSGRILRSTRVEPEVFSSLMVPEAGVPETLGSGGVAMISSLRNDIHVTVVFNGIFSPTDARDVVVKVSIAEKPNGLTEVSSNNITLAKINTEYNVASVKLTLSSDHQLLLLEGKLLMKISSPDGKRHLVGPIVVRPTCNVFQAVLTAESSNSGFAVLNINADGSIAYQAYASGMMGHPKRAVLETDSPADNEVWTLAESSSPPYEFHWTNGTFSATTTQILEMLLTDDLTFKLLAENSGELRGRVKQRLYSDAFLGDTPVLLVPDGNSSAAGQAWLSVDKKCQLHYSVFVSGLESNERHLLVLLEIAAPNSPLFASSRSVHRVLQKFTGDELEDVLEDPSQATLYRLSRGSSYLQVTSKSGGSNQVQLRGHIRNISIPLSCLPTGDGKSVMAFNTMNDENEIYRIDSSYKCYYEGEVFEDGAQWTAHHEECVMCSCQRGRLVCDPVVCPPVMCDNPITLPGECCKTCPDESTASTSSPGSNSSLSPMDTNKTSRSCYFEGDKKYHLAGSKWHPYIPPFGFSRCAVCTCHPQELKVECRRITCPPLNCPENEAYREHDVSCCKKCPNKIQVKSHVTAPASPNQPMDQRSEKTKLSPKEILAKGGCDFQGQVFQNGAEWHPTVLPFGEMKCINCNCKDGKSRCRRPRCPVLNCPVKIQKEDECCPKCADTSR